MNFYVFYHANDGIPVFDRHTPYEDRAEERVKELQVLRPDSKPFYSSKLPEKCYY